MASAGCVYAGCGYLTIVRCAYFLRAITKWFLKLATNQCTATVLPYSTTTTLLVFNASLLPATQMNLIKIQ